MNPRTPLASHTTLLVIGMPLTETQAAEVIFRTTQYPLMHPDRHTRHTTERILGLPEHSTLDHFTPQNRHTYQQHLTQWKHQHQVIGVQHFAVQRILALTPAGVQGWIDWNGSISHLQPSALNPSEQTLDQELHLLAKAFPFLNLQVIVPDPHLKTVLYHRTLQHAQIQPGPLDLQKALQGHPHSDMQHLLEQHQLHQDFKGPPKPMVGLPPEELRRRHQAFLQQLPFEPLENPHETTFL